MKLIVGLGNPGEKYVSTRHNTGFLVADTLSAKVRNSKSEALNKSKILIFKSRSFMNESGAFIEKLIKQYGIKSQDLYIVHDDLDIPLGSYKIQFGVGPKVHNGVNSIEETLGTNDFWRVRVGIENRAQRSGLSGEEYVLQDFTEEERKVLDSTIKKLLIDLIAKIGE